MLCWNKTKLLPNSFPGVYQLKCTCNSAYFGETKKKIWTRNTEHQQDRFKGKWDYSGATQHSLIFHGQFNWIHIKTIARERQRDRERQTERLRDRAREGERERGKRERRESETERLRDRAREGERERGKRERRESETERDKEIETETERQRDRDRDREIIEIEKYGKP